jgi:hypothetical protein
VTSFGGIVDRGGFQIERLRAKTPCLAASRVKNAQGGSGFASGGDIWAIGKGRPIQVGPHDVLGEKAMNPVKSRAAS